MALKLKGSTSGFVALDSPAVAGNNTITLPDSNGSANQVWANDNTAGVTTYTQVTINRNGDIVTPGTLSIGGTITYEDVTNVDSVGLVTARSGIEIGARPGVAASISVDGNMIVSGISTFGGDVQVPDKIIHSGDTNTAIRFPAADTVSVETGGSERLRIDSSGRLLFGINSSISGIPIQIASGYIQQYVAGNNADPGYLDILKTRNTSASGNTILQDGDQIGQLRFRGNTGSGYVNGALIRAVVNGTPGSGNDLPTDLQFHTMPDGSGSSAERLRIASDGDIGLGESNPNRSGYSSPVVSVGYNTGNGYGVLELLGNKTSDSAIANIVAYNIGGSSRVAAIAFERSGANNSGAIRFETYASGSSGERLRITSDGNVGMGGNTNPTNVLHIKTAATNTAVATIESTATDSYPFLRLKNDAREYQLTCHGGLSDAFTIYDGTSSAHRFTIDSSGKVGMNESSPDQALHIKGDNPFLELEGTSNSGDTGIFLNAKSNHWLLRSDNYGSQNLFTIKSGDTSSSTHRFAINSSGYVGINETSPVNLLTISNTATHTDDSIGNLQVRYTGSGATANSGITVKNYKGTSQFMQWESSGLRMGNRVVTNSGNGHVYITAGSDTVRLSINASTGNFTGSSSADISDGRLKENITSISNATAIIKQLLGKTFTWKEEAKLGTDKKYGFIAQEMKTVLPDLVYQDVGINRLSKDTDKQGYGQGEIVSDYSDDYKDDTKSEWSMAVQTSGVIPILVEAFKELEARIAALET